MATVFSIDEIFKENGKLKDAAEASGRHYEYRPQQLQMAQSVQHSLKSNSHLVVEAPTGTGKSFAYLVPAIEHALSSGKPVVISTDTISLQEQIIANDLPAIQKILNVEFQAALAKGRGNYLCLRRLNSAADRNMDYLPSDDLIPEIDQIYYWSRTAKNGSKSELDFKVNFEAWGSVNSEEGNCLNQSCPYYKPCFFQKSRRELQDAQVIVANHALLFCDLAIKSETRDLNAGILPNYGAVIFDEAHTVEHNAAMNLGLRLHPGSVFKVLHRIYHPKRGRGLMQRAGESFLDFYGKFYRQCQHYFEYINDWFEDRPLPWRYNDPGAMPDHLGPGFMDLEARLMEAISGEEDAERLVELTSVKMRCEKIRMSFDLFINMRDDNFVYWFDASGSAQNRTVSMNAVPVDVAPLLKSLLFEQEIPAVLTSATLAVDDKLEYLCQRIGLGNRHDVILDSPFSYKDQVKAYIGGSMPDPRDTHAFALACEEQIKKLLLETEGKAFILFTSYRFMNDMAERLRPFLVSKNWTLLKQGDGLGNLKLVEQFKKDVHSVLFGTDSFWTGIDVPGEALSNVIIVKLPFAVPDHPVVQAKIEHINRQNGNSFMELSVPEAVLKLRQGVGRLIRSKTDTGIIAILDSRVKTKRYGQVFLKSLPDCDVEFI
ncbi:MAG: ATP-dependent DNA helicase [Lentisphaerales bacterium]|nr:ATP-dependent DNA helicase [Lentisphaerales bacterium]